MPDSIVRSVLVCGLPASGKTTFLAALWHTVQTQEVRTALTLDSLAFGDYEYLNAIRQRWQRGRRQPRTVGPAQRVGIDFRSSSGRKARLVFLDRSGETFDNLWDTRSCSHEVAEQLRQRDGILLFLRSWGLKEPVSLAEILTIEAEMINASPSVEPQGDSVEPQGDAPEDKTTRWSAESAPDQVKIVDLLQTLVRNFEISRPERLAIVVSAWDRVEEYGTAEAFVEQRMPLLWQYLRYGEHGFEFRLYAVSAQGGEYVKEEHAGDYPQELVNLLTLEQPSTRVRLFQAKIPDHDLTVPLKWLLDGEAEFSDDES